jgi:hypothetical protein
MHRRIWAELKRRAAGDEWALAMWRAYISFLESRPKLSADAPDTAVHHILWRAEYPRYIKSNWNLIRLTHDDHTAAAALMLAAEPRNGKLRDGFRITYKISGNNLRWRPKNPREVIHFYQENRSLKISARKFNVSGRTIKNFLRRHGIKILRPDGRTFRWRPRNPNNIIRFYEEGQTLVALGKRFNVTEHAVRNFLNRNGVKRRGMSEARFWKPRNAKKLIQSYKRGQSLTGLGTGFGVSYNTVHRFLNREGVRVRGRSEAIKLAKAA